MSEDNKDVDLYDPKFVHFEWDDGLKGKKGFFADHIETIKKELYYKGPRIMGTLLHYSDSEAYPFVVEFRGGTGRWGFFYYDPNYEVKWAYFKEGKEVQMRRGSIDSWEDIYPWGKTVAVEGPEYFDDEYQYRIKPEEDSKPNVEVNVDVRVNNTSSDDKVKITINGKECVFENAEQARMVLKG